MLHLQELMVREQVVHWQLLWLLLCWGLLQSWALLCLSHLTQEELENRGLDGQHLGGVQGGLAG